MRVAGSVRKVAVALVAMLLVAALPAPRAAAAASPSAPAVATFSGQFRAYWVDAFGDGLYTSAQIDDVIAATKAIRANAIVAQIVRRGDCFCNRSLAPRTELAGVDPAPFDPLQTLIDKAHANGIEVHAWVIATAMWRGDTAPSSPQHIFNLHGPATSGAANWVLKRSDGLAVMSNTDVMLDPGHPDAAQWVVDVATSIVRNYDVDGINLDRIRYPDQNLGTNVPSWGYNATAVARFNAETGRSGTPSNTDPVWTQWRRDQITSIVRKVYIESFALKPNVRVSVDTITYGYGPQRNGWTNTRTYAEVLQDWDGWLREGIVDTNILMNYKRDADPAQAVMYREWSDHAKDNQYARQNVIGTGLYLNSVPSSGAQAQVAIQASARGNVSAGWAGYSYRTPDDLTNAGTRSGAESRAALAATLQPVFASPAAVATMPWKTQPTLGHVRGTTTPAATVSLVSSSSGAVVRTQKADGKGWFAFVDVAPGTYRVLANGVAMGNAVVVAGQLAPITPAATCTSTVGPGIPPPGQVPSGLSGFHAAWYGQSGYMTLCPNDTATATVAYRNTGTRGWLRGKMGEVAYLGTWAPEPGQDRPSPLGGDGTMGSPSTGWPRYDRIALQPHEWVGPNQVAWFQFTVKAPATPGTYRLYLRPLIEGATWMEDYGVYWLVTVKAP